ncbi:MAG: hypothetical protein WED00_08980, partial [Aquisalimonadaceae bacterium]
TFVWAHDIGRGLYGKGPKVSKPHEEKANAGQNSPESGNSTPTQIEVKTKGDEWIEAKAIGEGRDLGIQRPANMVPPDDVIHMVAEAKNGG